MNFKKSKEALLQDIRTTAYSAVCQSINSMSNMAPSAWDYAIKQAITDAITESFEVLVENTYTDQEFEEDIKLKS